MSDNAPDQLTVTDWLYTKVLFEGTAAEVTAWLHSAGAKQCRVNTKEQMRSWHPELYESPCEARQPRGG